MKNKAGELYKNSGNNLKELISVGNWLVGYYSPYYSCALRSS